MPKITEIHIKQLWGDPDFNIHWKLNADVNILAGDNGSGKTTIFELVEKLLQNENTREIAEKVAEIVVEFDDNTVIFFSQEYGFSLNAGLGAGLDFGAGLGENVAYIRGFDKNIVPNYAESSSERQNLFFDKMDNLFAQSKKTINRNGNKNDAALFFTSYKNQRIEVTQLSSGEKQILHILVTALNSNEKPIIILIDEPERSLHTDWQRTLIDNIRSLNPHVQLLVATHAPLLIVNGWAGNVQQMDKIIRSK